jgi:hypothetical protein
MTDVYEDRLEQVKTLSLIKYYICMAFFSTSSFIKTLKVVKKISGLSKTISAFLLFRFLRAINLYYVHISFI